MVIFEENYPTLTASKLHFEISYGLEIARHDRYIINLESTKLFSFFFVIGRIFCNSTISWPKVVFVNWSDSAQLPDSGEGASVSCRLENRRGSAVEPP